MNDSSSPLRVLMELYEAEVDRFIEYLGGLSPQDLQARAEFAGQVVSIEEILAHVERSGLGYAQDARSALHGASGATGVGEGEWIARLRSILPVMREAL